jgi:hypothetical protein
MISVGLGSARAPGCATGCPVHPKADHPRTRNRGETPVGSLRGSGVSA